MQFFDKFFNTVTVRPNRKLIPELVIDKIKGQGAKAFLIWYRNVHRMLPAR